MSLIIPLAALPAQYVTSVVNGQNCRIVVYQKSTGMYADLYVNEVAVFTCGICRNGVPLISAPYSGFVGDFVFFDMEGQTDPTYAGLGTRYFLAYLFPDELP